jgi:hypothetical protein
MRFVKLQILLRLSNNHNQFVSFSRHNNRCLNLLKLKIMLKARKKLSLFLSYTRLAIAGAIGGVAVYNTAVMIASATPSQSVESIAMAAGAVLAAGIAKILHVA